MHALHLPGMRGGVVVEEELPRLADALRHGLEDRPSRREDGLLRDAGELQCGREPEPAVVGSCATLDDFQQARLAGAVAPDEADVLARLDHQVRMIEQRDVAVGEGDFGKLEEGHRGRIGESWHPYDPLAGILGSMNSELWAYSAAW